MAINLDLRKPVPRCGTPNHPDVARQDCPRCVAWGRYIGALRRDAIASGLAQKRTGPPAPWRRKPELLIPKPKCTKHTRDKDYTCQVCIDRSAYLSASRRYERRNGVDNTRKPITEARQHIEMLVTTGGHTHRSIAERAGLTTATIGRVRGTRVSNQETIDSLTHESIIAVQPRSHGAGLRVGHVPVLAAKRIVQGLAAQGWRMERIARAAGYKTKNGVANILASGQHSITLKLDQKMRRVAALLGDQDITTLSRPYPAGMHLRCYNDAQRHGWVPLWAWEGQDLADPDAVPDLDRMPPGEPIEQDPVSQAAYVDQALYGRVRAAAEAVIDTNRIDARTRTFVPPLGRLTRLEVHVVAMVAEDAGLSSTETGQILGYSQNTKASREAGERQASRLRKTVRAAREWIDQHPAGETPAWFTQPRLPAGRVDMTRVIPVLLAVQPAPYGPGWSIGELAVRCAVDDEQMSGYLAWAARLAGDWWNRKASANKPRRVVRHALPRAVTRTDTRAA